MAATPRAPTPILIADIGGTNVRFAIAHGDGRISDVDVLNCSDFAEPADAAEYYLKHLPVEPARAPRSGAFAVAGPVLGDHVHMTNHRWSFSIEETRRRLGLARLEVINDFAAIALSLPRLADDDRFAVGGGEAAAGTPLAVLGPGTGLGVSALVPAGKGWTPLATEGGHVTMAAADDREHAVLRVLRRTFGHASAERVLSGPGLVNLFRAISELEGQTPEPKATPEGITRRALEGSCTISVEALGMFSAMLGTVASDLALTLGARGGVYIAGGIVPQLGEAFDRSGFRKRFEDKGRYSAYLAAIPTFVVTHPYPAFPGLCALLAERRAP